MINRIKKKRVLKKLWNLNFWPSLSITDQGRSLTNASQTSLLHRNADSDVSIVNIFHLKFNRVDFIERTIQDILYTGDACNGSNYEGDRKSRNGRKYTQIPKRGIW